MPSVSHRIVPGSIDWIKAWQNMMETTALFGTQSETRSFSHPPMRPGTIGFTPTAYALIVIEFYQETAVEMFRSIGSSLMIDELVQTQESVMRGNIAGPLMISEWRRIAVAHNQVFGGSSIFDTGESELGRQVRLVLKLADAATGALLAFGRGSSLAHAVPNDDGVGSHLDALDAVEFWGFWSQYSVAAQEAELVIDRPDAASILVEAINEAPGVVGDALEDIGDAASRTAAKLAKTAANIAGSGIKEFFKELGIVPIAIGAAAIYVGVAVL